MKSHVKIQSTCKRVSFSALTHNFESWFRLQKMVHRTVVTHPESHPFLRGYTRVWTLKNIFSTTAWMLLLSLFSSWWDKSNFHITGKPFPSKQPIATRFHIEYRPYNEHIVCCVEVFATQKFSCISPDASIRTNFLKFVQIFCRLCLFRPSILNVTAFFGHHLFLPQTCKCSVHLCWLTDRFLPS